MAKKPKWMRIAEEFARDKEVLKIMRAFRKAKDHSKRWVELGHQVHSFLEQMSDEFLSGYEWADWLGQYMEGQIREKMDNYFFQQVDKILAEERRV